MIKLSLPVSQSLMSDEVNDIIKRIDQDCSDELQSMFEEVDGYCSATGKSLRASLEHNKINCKDQSQFHRRNGML